MILNNKFFKRIEAVCTGKYHFEKHEGILKYQVLLLKILIILSILLIGIIAIVRFYEGNITQAIADIIFIVILGINFYFLYRDKYYFKIISRIVIGSALLTIVALMYNTPEAFSPIIWITTTVYLMFFLLSRREAWKWLFAVLIFIVITHSTEFAFDNFEFSDIFILISNIFLLSLVLTWYEKIKEDNEEQHIKNKILLEKEVQIKTKELSESNEALEELNKTLEQRVNSEIEKNAKKDTIMMAQSRQAAMGDMISMIAHQWRQPITAIGMGAQNIQLDIELEDIDTKRFDMKLTKIVEQTEFLSKTIDDFRNFLKPNKKPSSCMFCKIAEDTLTIIGKSLENNNITLEKSYEDDLEITTFRNEVIQVLLNIINNSKDVMKIKEMDDGIIWLNISHNDEMAIFKICDNAGGIPDDILPRIFEPYFTTKEEKGGTGLGLYMSQMIVEKHLKGTIKAQNIDNGLCMRVSIPLNIDKGNLDD